MSSLQAQQEIPSFNVELVSRDRDSYDETLENVLPTSTESKDGILCLGYMDGSIIIRNFHYDLIQKLEAYDNIPVSHLVPIDHSSWLLSLAESSGNLIIKLWDFSGKARLMSTLSIPVGSSPYPVSAMAASRDACQIAIGLSNGIVILVRGDLPRDRGARHRVISRCSDPITGLHFSLTSQSKLLYICSTSQVLSSNIENRNIPSPVIVDAQGCALGCSEYDSASKSLVVARTEGITTYSSPKIKKFFPCYSLKKRLILIGNGRIGLVVEEASTAPTRTLSNSEKNPLRNSSEEIYILRPQFSQVELVFRPEYHVLCIASDGSNLFVLDMKLQLFKTVEKSATEKTQIFIDSHNFELGFKVAAKDNYSDRLVTQLHLENANYLFHLEKYDEAVIHYAACATETDTSTILRKYIQIQQFKPLVKFLECLVDRNIAYVQHITLLVSCYIKMEDIARLEKLIYDLKENLDSESVVAVCIEFNYFEYAAYLSAKYRRWDTYLEILCFNLQNWNAALTCYCGLKPVEFKDLIMEFGPIIMEKLPDELTQLVIKWVTLKFSPSIFKIDVNDLRTDSSKFPPSILPLLICNPFFSGEENGPASLDSQPRSSEEGRQQLFSMSNLAYQVENPFEYMRLFVNHNSKLIEFLESYIKWLENQDDSPSTNISEAKRFLYEAYLRERNNESNAETKEAFRLKALKLINSIDPDSQNTDWIGLNLVSLESKFEEGLITALQKQGRLQDVFLQLSQKNDIEGMIDVIQNIKISDPAETYPVILTYFIRHSGAMKEHPRILGEVLNKIEQGNYLTPREVLQILCKNEHITVGMIKDYLSTIFDREKYEIENLENLIDNFNIQVKKTTQELSKVSGEVNKIQASRCSACSGFLELPIIHFLCGHSYHYNCIKKNENECLKCSKTLVSVRSLYLGKEYSVEKQKAFEQSMKESNNKTDFILSGLSRLRF